MHLVWSTNLFRRASLKTNVFYLYIGKILYWLTLLFNLTFFGLLLTWTRFI